MTYERILETLLRHAAPSSEQLGNRPFAELMVSEVIDSSLDAIELMMEIEDKVGVTEDAINGAELPARLRGMTFCQLAQELVSLRG